MSARSRTRRGSPLHIERARDLFPKSRDIVLNNIWIFAPLYFVLLIFQFHSWIWTPAPGSHVQTGHWTRYSWLGSGFTTSLPSYAWYTLVGFSILWFLFVVSAGTIVQIMAQEAQLLGARRQVITFDRLKAVVKELGWRMFGLYLLIGLYVFVGLILFIVPGLIMLRRYFLAPYVLLDEKTSIKAAMDKSAAMTKPFSGSIWSIIGVMFLIGLINIIPFVGWMVAFVVGMFYSAAPVLRYLELKKITQEA